MSGAPRDPLGGEPLHALARDLVEALASASLTIAFAESCTGGLLSTTVTDIPGASRVFWGAVVSYTVAAKTDWLGVDPSIIDRHGVVSTATAAAMAEGLLSRSKADLAVAVTGWAGPDAPPGEDGPGRVCVAWARRSGATLALERRLKGNRRAVREEAAAFALGKALDLVSRQ